MSLLYLVKHRWLKVAFFLVLSHCLAEIRTTRDFVYGRQHQTHVVKKLSYVIVPVTKVW